MNTLRLAYNKYIKQLKDAGVQASEIPPICDVNHTLFLAYLKNIKDTIKQYKKHSEGGSIVTFNALPNTNIENLIIGIEAVQSGSGDPSPDNVRPISGWTGLKVTRTAKNLFGGTLMRDGVLECVPGAADYPEDRYVQYTSDATVRAGGFTQNCGLTDKFKENTSYTFIITYAKSSNVGSNMRIYYTDGTYTNIPVLTDASAKETKVVVTPPNKTVSAITKFNQSAITKLYYNESGIFEGDLTADDFVPYEGQTYSVDWETEARTVYGGTLDVTTGVLTVNWIVSSPEFGSSWTKTGTSSWWRTYSDKKRTTNSAICSHFTTRTYTTSDRIQLNDTGFTTIEELANYQAEQTANNTPIQIGRLLATPRTYQLTPLEIKAITGINNLWADTGDIISFDYYGT